MLILIKRLLSCLQNGKCEMEKGALLKCLMMQGEWIMLQGE